MASAGRTDEGLAAVLGDLRSTKLREILRARLLSWADEVALGGGLLADQGGGLLADQGGVLLADPTETPVDAAVRVLDGEDRPLLIAWPDLARWRPEHATGALDDLRDGCELSVGPVFDGGFYLVACAHPLAVVPTLPNDVWHSADAMAIAFAAAHRAGAEAGMLRAERGLHSASDVRAALADPLLDAELRSLLEAVG